MGIKLKQLKTKKVTRGIMVWLDILGFRSLIYDLEKGNEESGYQIEKLERLIKDIPQQFRFEHTLTLFSDTILISFPCHLDDAEIEEKMFEIPFEIGRMQLGFLKAGFLLRGAITLGRFYEGKYIKSSSFYQSLYEHEIKHAKVPRIICVLDDKLGDEDDPLDFIQEHIRAWEVSGNLFFEAGKPLMFDSDGFPFVDYLSWHNTGGDLKIIEYHKQFIEDCAVKFSKHKSILKKYLWMAKYHNRVLREWDIEDFEGTKYDEKEQRFTLYETGKELKKILRTLRVNLSLFPKGLRTP